MSNKQGGAVTRKLAIELCDEAIANLKHHHIDDVECQLTELRKLLKALLNEAEEGREVTVYDTFKGRRYGTCNGTIERKCGCDLSETGIDKCSKCGIKLIWPNTDEQEGKG